MKPFRFTFLPGMILMLAMGIIDWMNGEGYRMLLGGAIMFFVTTACAAIQFTEYFGQFQTDEDEEENEDPR